MAGNPSAEAERADYDPWHNRRQDHQVHQQVEPRIECRDQDVGAKQADRDRPPLEDLARTRVVSEGDSVQQRVAVKVAARAHQRPGRIDPERDHGQQDVDRPDAEIFACRTCEHEKVRRRRRDLRLHHRRCVLNRRERTQNGRRHGARSEAVTLGTARGGQCSRSPGLGVSYFTRIGSGAARCGFSDAR